MPPPLLGLLSDTHGHADRAAAAVRALRAGGATLILHLGDVGSEAVLEELVGTNARVVFGNCDDETLLRRHAERLGIAVDHPLGRLEFEGVRIAYSHGHLPHLLEQAQRDGVDWLFHGHTHVIRDEVRGATRIVNPGALHRAERYTVALVDLAAARSLPAARSAVRVIDVAG
ncbi:MAG: YfcE family phosphodiesterase [Phycisphaerales bacterium]